MPKHFGYFIADSQIKTILFKIDKILISAHFEGQKFEFQCLPYKMPNFLILTFFKCYKFELFKFDF